MIFRVAKEQDKPQIMRLIKQAILQMKNQGSEQWQDGYPNEQVVDEDIRLGEGYVAEENGKILGIISLVVKQVETYDAIEGAWLTNDNNYLAIHRFVVDKELKGKGLAASILKQAQKICIQRKLKSIRTDTYCKNIAAQRFFEKNGFKKCGIVVWDEGKTNPAYEKIIVK